MKILVLNYSFSASAKQITFTDYNPIVAERVLLITNTTDGIIIYNFADPLKGGTCATNVLTLAHDTTAMSNTDKLQIFYDDNATTMPVSGTVTANLSAVDNAVLDVIAAKDFATQTTLAALNAKMVTGTDIGDVTINNAAGAAAVNIQDGGNSITVDGAFYQATQPVSIATMPSTPVTNADLATLAGAVSATHMQVDVLTMPAGGAGLTDLELRATAVPVSVASIPSHAVTNAGTFAVQESGGVAHDAADSGNPIKIGGRASTTPVTAVAANDRVDGFFDVQGRQVVAQKALTGTLSNVDGSASNVTLLAANTARLGATVYNDSTAILYLKLGATASATSFTVKMQPDDYYEIPFGYYGTVDGIWASATGFARVTEIT